MTATKTKQYRAHVQFVALGVNVRAKTRTEAKRKVKKRVAAMNAARLIDTGNFWVDCV